MNGTNNLNCNIPYTRSDQLFIIYRWAIYCSYERLRKVDQFRDLNFIFSNRQIIRNNQIIRLSKHQIIRTSDYQIINSHQAIRLSTMTSHQVIKHGSSSLSHLSWIQPCRTGCQRGEMVTQVVSAHLFGCCQTCT